MTGQCSPELVSKIKGSDLYESADQDQDVVQLILIVHGYCCRFDDHQQGTWALMSRMHHTLIFYQNYEISMTDHFKNFKALIGVVALGLLANLKETREVKQACRVKATSIRSVVKEVMVVVPKWEL